MREHGYRLHPLEPVAAPGKLADIARERGGIAGDVDDARGREGGQRGERFGMEARSRRVANRHVGGYPAAEELGKGEADLARHEGAVGDPVAAALRTAS